MALPRGGVAVAREIADQLGVELDVCLVRKLGVPWQPELAFGAVAEGGIRVLDAELVKRCRLRPEEIERMSERAEQEIERQRPLYRGARPAAEVKGRTVIVVDDGLATGSTMLAAVRALRAKGAARVVVAAPVAPPSTCEALRAVADEVVCLETPEPFVSVGSWYEDFRQVEDEEVRTALEAAAGRPAKP